MQQSLLTQLSICKLSNIKPNFAELAREIVGGDVTVTPAPIKSTKVYPNSETGYSGSTFDAKDSTSVTLTVSVTSDEGAGLTYTWYRSINDVWRSLTSSSITQGLTEKYAGADSQTLSITELPAGQTFSYKVQIVTDDGYKCFSKPFTVSTCAHDGDKTLQHDETHHWYVCGKCGAELDRAEHSGGTATCTAKAVCSTCQTAYGELGGHTLTKHDAVDANCTAPGNVEYWHCSVCNKNSSDSTGTEELTEITSPALNHTWGAWEKVSETQHQRICQNDGSHKETGDHTPGTAATCKAPANCSICGQPYGEKNPSNHTGGAEVRNQKEATTTTEGYTGDTYCLGCGEKIASGTVIPKKPSGGGSFGGGFYVPTTQKPEIKAAAGDLVLTARSAKLKNGSVKIMLKGDLKAITDAGYTVKYKFYRSTKKSAGYKAMLTKKAPIYVNTYGKKGTMYYYKARVMIYDKDGNFVAQTALKQCKYANRLWTK